MFRGSRLRFAPLLLLLSRVFVVVEKIIFDVISAWLPCWCCSVAFDFSPLLLRFARPARAAGSFPFRVRVWLVSVASFACRACAFGRLVLRLAPVCRRPRAAALAVLGLGFGLLCSALSVRLRF